MAYMIESERIDNPSTAEKFLMLDEAIFEIPDSTETLGKVIDQFHKVSEELNVFNETIARDQAYFKYRFEDPEVPNLEISLYTPAPSPEPAINHMSDKNTHAFFVWSNVNTYEIVRPLENDRDKGKYLRALKLVVAQKMQRRDNGNE